MMTKLDTILQIASAASESKSVNDAYCDFVKTFNPSLITKMIEEIKATREFLDQNKYWWGEHEAAKKALDAELSPKEQRE